MNKQRRNRSKMNIPMCVACVLLCLTLFTTHLMFGLYAKYTAKGSGGDEARVAKFGDVTIIENGDSLGDTFVVTPGVDIVKDVEISFTGSEMACYLFVVVEPSGWTGVKNVNEEVTSFIAFNGKASDQNATWFVDSNWMYLTQEDGKYVYYDLLQPNESLDKLDFIDSGNIIVGDKITASMLVTESRKLSFYAIVAQWDGKSTAAQAWDSVKNK